WRQLKLGLFTFAFAQASVLFPYIIQAPRFFAKTITLGDLQQTGNAFNQVVDALSFIINSYTTIATWFAVVHRLATFDESVADILKEQKEPPTLPIAHQGAGLSTSG